MLQNFYESISPTVRPVRGGAACGITGHLFSLSRCHSAILTKPLTLWVPQFLQLWNEQNSPSSSCSLLRKVKRRLSLHDEGLTVPFLEMQDFSSLSSLTVIQVIYFFWGGARIQEWVAIPFSRRSSRPKDRTQVSHIVGRCFTTWAPGKSIRYLSNCL